MEAEISRMEVDGAGWRWVHVLVIPFCYVTCFAKIFLLLLFHLFHNIQQVWCYHFFIVEIIVESVNFIQISK